MADHAAHAGLGRRSEDPVFDRRVEVAGEEKGGIVASGTPFGSLHAIDFLHVLDALAIPLIVERREMMRGALPLPIDVRVAMLADGGVKEIILRDGFARVGLAGTWEEVAAGAVAFGVHGRGGDRRIFDSVGALPRNRAHAPGTGCDKRGSRHKYGGAQESNGSATAREEATPSS